MQPSEKQFVETLSKIGEKIKPMHSPIRITDIQSLDKAVQPVPGVYWIMTTMPTTKMCKAIKKVTKKDRRLRINPPSETTLIKQEGTSSYVAYSGTHVDVNQRLKEHLFNKGNARTGKLGCKIHTKQFSSYSWNIYYKHVSSYELRYAIEAWWRLNRGWPPFCIR